MHRAMAAITLAIALLLVCRPAAAGAQQPSLSGQSSGSQPPPPPRQETLDDTIEAGDEELATPKKDLVKWNHYDGDFFHIRLGGGFLYEGATYSQNAASAEQFDLS